MEIVTHIIKEKNNTNNKQKNKKILEKIFLFLKGNRHIHAHEDIPLMSHGDACRFQSSSMDINKKEMIEYDNEQLVK